MISAIICRFRVYTTSEKQSAFLGVFYSFLPIALQFRVLLLSPRPPVRARAVTPVKTAESPKNGAFRGFCYFDGQSLKEFGLPWFSFISLLIISKIFRIFANENRLPANRAKNLPQNLANRKRNCTVVKVSL